MRVIDAQALQNAVKTLYIEANFKLPCDVRTALDCAAANEPWEGAKNTLATIIENAEIAERENIPICQDTGMAHVFLDIGSGVYIDGDINAAVNRGIAVACREGYLRASIVSDPLRRDNTGDNTPAAIYIEQIPGENVKITVAPKGFGSENMSRVIMLKPSDGEPGVIDFVLETVERAGASPCPPVVLGIGIGGSFDRVAYHAKRALLRPIDVRNAEPYYARLEQTLLEQINTLGIGPMGIGGRTTALGVNIITAPTHIAGLPVAVCIGCHATRHASAVV